MSMSAEAVGSGSQRLSQVQAHPLGDRPFSGTIQQRSLWETRFGNKEQEARSVGKNCTLAKSDFAASRLARDGINSPSQFEFVFAQPAP